MAWHTTTPIAENVYRISEPLGAVEPRYGIATVNTYLVVGQERAALIDTGMGVGDLRAEARKLTSLPVLALNSHYHWDHTGANALFTERAIHADEAELLAQAPDVSGIRQAMQSLAARAALPPGFDPSAYRIIPARPTRLLNEGDEVDLGGRTLRVLHTPGHTPGHVAFFDQANGILFTADVAYCGPMFLCFEECDPAAFARSVRRLAALQGVKLLCPGHEAIISNSGWLAELAERVDAALAGQLRGEAHDGFLRGRHVRFDGYSIWLPL